MKGVFLAFLAVVALTHAAPQVRFSAKDYEAFQQALGDRIPVAIQTAIRVLASSESNPTDFVVLNFNGLSGPTATTDSAAAGGVAIARTGSAPASDDVAETFSEVAEDAVEDVREAAEDAAEEADDTEVNRILITDDTVAEPPAVAAGDQMAVTDATDAPAPTSPVDNALGDGANAAATDDTVEGTVDTVAPVVNALDDGAVATADDNVDGTVVDTVAPVTEAVQETENDASVAPADEPAVQENTVDTITGEEAAPATTPTEATTTAAAVPDTAALASRTGLAAEAEEEEDAPAAAAPVEAESEVMANQIVAAAIEAARRKRQNEETRQRQAISLGNALSHLGLLVVRRN